MDSDPTVQQKMEIDRRQGRMVSWLPTYMLKPTQIIVSCDPNSTQEDQWSTENVLHFGSSSLRNKLDQYI